MLRVAQYGLTGIADVAGECDLPRLAVFRQPYLYRRRAEKMPHVRQAYGDALVYLDALAVGARAHELERALRVLHVVQRLCGRLAPALPLAGFPLRVGHLDVRAVAQHYLAERACCAACIYQPAVAVLIEQRQLAGVIDVRMRQKHKVQLSRRDGERFIDKKILPLLHAAVNDALFVADLYVGHAAGDFVRRAQECYLHTLPSFLVI